MQGRTYPPAQSSPTHHPCPATSGLFYSTCEGWEPAPSSLVPLPADVWLVRFSGAGPLEVRGVFHKRPFGTIWVDRQGLPSLTHHSQTTFSHVLSQAGSTQFDSQSKRQRFCATRRARAVPTPGLGTGTTGGGRCWPTAAVAGSPPSFSGSGGEEGRQRSWSSLGTCARYAAQWHSERGPTVFCQIP